MTSIDQLYTELDKTYKLVHFADLGTITDQHGSVFRLLKSLRKDSFDPDERIVFYSSYKPSQLILDHLQLAASKIDISNWFIMVCGPEDITIQLHQANKKFGYDEVDISWYPSVINTTIDINKNGIYPHDTMCFLPFNSLSLDTDFNATPCCKYQGSLGDAKKQTLKEIMVGNEATELRRLFKQGIKPQACQTCWDTEKSGSTSQRQIFLSKFRDVGDLYHVDTPVVRNLSTSPSIICNFKCRICDYRSSSAIAAEDMSFTTDESVKKDLLLRIQDKSLIDINDYFQVVKPVLNEIEDLHILGGEPFLMKNLEGLLEYIIQQEHQQHIKIVTNTNSSVWNDRIVNSLKKFQHTEVLLSIDDIGRRFETQRGGLWPDVNQNIQKWANVQSATFVVKVAPTVNIQNVLYLDQLVEYCQSLNLKMVWCYLEHPQELCIDYITKSAKELIYNKYYNHPESELRNIANRVLASKPVSGQSFINLMNKYDLRRNTSFASTHPEIFQAMSDR